MAKKSQKPHSTSDNVKARHKRRAMRRPGLPPTKPIAFRLPPDIVVMCDAAADDANLSRNKVVEHALRAAFGRFTVAKPEVCREQPDLFI